MTAAARTSRTRTSHARVDVVDKGPGAGQFLVGSVAVLCLLGLIMVYSASSVGAVASGHPSWYEAAQQLVFLVLGVVVALAISRVPISFWRRWPADTLLALSFLLQGYLAVAVILMKLGVDRVPLVHSSNGATRWLTFGGVTAQPSDLAKVALILWLARYLAHHKARLDQRNVQLTIVGVTAAMCVLVMMGNDLGTTLLLAGIMTVMSLLAGAPWRFILKLVVGGALLALLAIQFLDGFRGDRISAFVNPSDHAQTGAYQATQSKVGLATGGLFGSGPGNSRAKWGYLPEADTDFIFAIIGEELGLIGTLVVLGAFVTFMAATVRIGMRSRTDFGRLAAFGIAGWIGVQALVNIGVAVSVLPTKGITLPFMSRGGSSLVMCLLAVGLTLSVARDPA